MMRARWGTLDLAPIGNCTVAALIDRQARYVWACLPRVDGDPFFHALLGGEDPADESTRGLWSIDIAGFAQARQAPLRNTASCGRCWSRKGATKSRWRDLTPSFPPGGIRA